MYFLILANCESLNYSSHVFEEFLWIIYDIVTSSWHFLNRLYLLCKLISCSVLRKCVLFINSGDAGETISSFKKVIVLSWLELWYSPNKLKLIFGFHYFCELFCGNKDIYKCIGVDKIYKILESNLGITLEYPTH